MKDKFFVILRALCVLVIGVLLVAYKEQWAGALVIGMGIVFAAFGLCSVVSWIVRRKCRRDPGFFPVSGVAGLLLGLLMMLASQKFVNVFVYLAGGILLCLALFELVSLFSLRRDVKLPGWLFTTPVLALLMGGFALWNPTKAAALPFLISGIGCIICGTGWILAVFSWMIRRRKAKSE